MQQGWMIKLRELFKLLAMCCLVIVLVGVVTSWRNNDKQVEIIVENKTGAVLSNIIVSTESDYVTVEHLANDQRASIHLKLSGEGVYFVQAEQSSGQVIQSHGLYIESGYTVLSRVMGDKIESEYLSYF